MASNKIPSERTQASCGHNVSVRMTRDPDLNIERLKEASYMWCPRCQRNSNPHCGQNLPGCKVGYMHTHTECFA